MNIYLYGEKFEITESNICEARGKYLVRKSIKNADKFIRNECAKLSSVLEMTERIPKIIGTLMIQTTQHILYVLRQEGISTNGKVYINSVFKATDCACLKICQELKTNISNVNSLEKASDNLTEAGLKDLEKLWIGYFVAHGYSLEDEFYTYGKLEHAISELALLSVKKTVSPIKVCVEALRDAPYEDSIYKMVEIQLGSDKNLNLYRSLFLKPFKQGTYKDMLSPQELEELKYTLVKNIHRYFSLPEFNQIRCVYYAGVGNNPKAVQKIKAAVFVYAHLEKSEIPLLCFDSTVMGGAENGIIISTKGIYVHNPNKPSQFFHFNDIKTVKFNSKKIFINDQDVFTGGMLSSDIKRFASLICTICELIAPLYETERV